MDKKNNTEPTISINPMDIFNVPRKLDDIDLVQIIDTNITALGGQLVLPNFHNEMVQLGINKANPVVQRILLNRYFTNKLLVYRSRSGVNVIEILPFLASDGYVEDWLTLQKEIVLPFIVSHNVLTT